MTNEEAEQLITEINSYNYFLQPTRESLEKIIKRFANKPIYEYGDSRGNTVTLKESCIEVRASNGDFVGGMDFYCKGEIVCLKNTLAKMLEQLNAENN